MEVPALASSSVRNPAAVGAAAADAVAVRIPHSDYHSLGYRILYSARSSAVCGLRYGHSVDQMAEPELALAVRWLFV